MFFDRSYWLLFISKYLGGLSCMGSYDSFVDHPMLPFSHMLCLKIVVIVSRGDWLWNSANFKGLNNSAVSDVERTRHVTLTVHKFIQDGGQYKRSVSEGRRFWSHLDAWEDTEEVEEQCAVIVRNVSWNSGNSESKFRITVLKFAMHGLLDSCKQTKSNKRSRLY